MSSILSLEFILQSWQLCILSVMLLDVLNEIVDFFGTGI